MNTDANAPTFSRRDRVLAVTMNLPETLNAVSRALQEEEPFVGGLSAQTSEFRAAVMAFMEKRHAKYSG